MRWICNGSDDCMFLSGHHDIDRCSAFCAVLPFYFLDHDAAAAARSRRRIPRPAPRREEAPERRLRPRGSSRSTTAAGPSRRPSPGRIGGSSWSHGTTAPAPFGRRAVCCRSGRRGRRRCVSRRQWRAARRYGRRWLYPGRIRRGLDQRAQPQPQSFCWVCAISSSAE